MARLLRRRHGAFLLALGCGFSGALTTGDPVGTLDQRTKLPPIKFPDGRHLSLGHAPVQREELCSLKPQRSRVTHFQFRQIMLAQRLFRNPKSHGHLRIVAPYGH